MAIAQQTWTQLPDGRYRNDSTFQIVDRSQLTPDQLSRSGIPQATQGGTAGGSPTQGPRQDFMSSINGISPQDYAGTVDSGYENLGQPSKDPGTGRDQVTFSAVSALAKAFVDRFHQKGGKLPDEDAVKSFVAQTLTPGFAQKFIVGGISPDQINANVVDPYLQDNAGKIGLGGDAGTTESRILGLNDQLDKVYETGKNKFLEDTTANYGAQKQGLVNDLAGQGMLTQPNSRVSLDSLEANKNKSVASGLNALAGQKAAGALDLGTTIENLLQKQQEIGNQNSQFNKTYNAGREDTYFNQGLQNRQISLADTLGRLQANASKPGWMDYLNTALTGVGAVGGLATGLGNLGGAASKAGGFSKLFKF